MDRRSETTLPALPAGARIEKGERMPLHAGPPEPVRTGATGTKGGVRLALDESPVFLWLRTP
jgi:hypothetical protein